MNILLLMKIYLLFLLCWEYLVEHMLTPFMGQLIRCRFIVFLIILFYFSFCLTLLLLFLFLFTKHAILFVFLFKANFLKKRRIPTVTVTLSREYARMLESF